MNLYAKLQARAAQGKPVRVGLIGAGKFGSMYLSQVPRTPGIHLVGIADLSAERARAALKNVHWPEQRYGAATLEQAAGNGSTAIIEDSMALVASPFIDVVIDATGSPAAGIAHVLACCEHKKHIVMVNVEADALAGPLLKRRADEAGIIYTLAYGDQPALICEMVDWARATGFEVIAAGKGTKYLPAYHASTPATVWDYYGLTAQEAQLGGMNPQMFNSFLDGTKSALEMAAVANATGLAAPNGLAFPPVGVDDLARVLRPREDGGMLEQRGQVEVISSLERDGRPVFRDLRWGVYVTFAAGSEYVERCFKEYGLVTDPSGKYTSMYKPFHLIGLELGISVASAALRGESTGAPVCWNGDVVATAKRDLAEGETLDGEGGFTVYGKLMPAQDSMRLNGLPLGLAHGVKLKRAVAAGQAVSWNDVAFNADAQAVRFRREMEAVFAKEARLQAA
ncbi:MAG: oxidoreductase, NAD-binding Rossmann fold family protein [Paucimonas sp.]|nr:oxidoreductase, NAD-binding Rossmann fold family protein [Paucimonas sp.]